MDENKNKKKHITLGFLTSWILGTLFLLVGVMCFLNTKEYTVGFGLSCLFIGSILLPPIRNFVHQKTGQSMSSGLRIVLVIISFGVASSFLPETEELLGIDDFTEIISSQIPNAIAATTKHNLDILGYIKNDIINRCKIDMGEYGSMIVKGCVDQDIKAYKALQKYSEKYSGLIARCKIDMMDYGWMIMKSCIDQDIKAQKALDDY